MNSKISDKDKKDWNNFISSDEKLSDKDSFSNPKKRKRREIVFDLHGFSLEDANKKIFNLINDIRHADINDGGSGAFYIFLKKKL